MSSYHSKENSSFIIKVAGYRFNSYYINKDIVNSDIIDIPLKNRLFEVTVESHESGVEVLVVAVVTGIISSAIYDYIKVLVGKYKESWEGKQDKFDSDAEILIIRKRYALKLGTIRSNDNGGLEVDFYLSEDEIIEVLKTMPRGETVEEISRDLRDKVENLIVAKDIPLEEIRKEYEKVNFKKDKSN